MVIRLWRGRLRFPEPTDKGAAWRSAVKASALPFNSFKKIVRKMVFAIASFNECRQC